MDLQLYLQRINYSGPLAPDLKTLRGLHRHHLLALNYENFDIHLGRPVELNREAFFNKLVRQGRGGWCFEMNGLFAWALQEIGFEVRLLAGSVREESREASLGNHLVLLVELDRPYLADVGFGDGFLEPLPLEEGEYREDFLTFRLEKEGARWVFHNHSYGGAKRFDFTLTPYKLADFAAKSLELQTSPASGFVRTTVCQRLAPGRLLVLRGAVFKKISPAGVEETILDSAEAYRRVLEDYFGIYSGEIAGLWPRVWQNHTEWQRQLPGG